MQLPRRLQHMPSSVISAGTRSSLLQSQHLLPCPARKLAFNSTPAGALEQTEPFLEGKDLTIHHGARFHFCGCCFQRRHCKARRGAPTARSRFAHPGTWASPATTARMSQHGWQQVFGQQVSGGSPGCPARPSVTPSPRGAQGVVRALCPEGREGLPGRRSLPEQ